MGKIRRGRKKKRGRSVLKNNQRLNTEEASELKNAPHSFVFYRGNVSIENIEKLCKDFRKVMEPFTASQLQATKANRMKDFLSVSGLLHVSHMCIFSSSDCVTSLKIARTPRGPTLYLKILNYSLAKDVKSSLKKQLEFEQQFQHPPLVILNNFGGEDVHKKIMASMFQNMFPPLNLTKINLNNVRRCVLFNLNPETNVIDFRHYSIKVVPVNLSKGVKKIVQNKVPDLSKFDDTADFIAKGNLLSESEGEDDPASHVTLSQKLSSRGNLPSQQSSIRLIELGPRISFQLLKIEEDFMTGEVLYHQLVHKTEEQKNELLQKRLEKKRLKEQRKQEQEDKKNRKELMKKREAEKAEAKKEARKKEMREEGDNDNMNDADWFKSEVGEEPDEDTFSKGGQKRKTPFRDVIKNKRAKKSDGSEDKGEKKVFKSKNFQNKAKAKSPNFKAKGKSPAFKTKGKSPNFKNKGKGMSPNFKNKTKGKTPNFKSKNRNRNKK